MKTPLSKRLITFITLLTVFMTMTPISFANSETEGEGILRLYFACGNTWYGTGDEIPVLEWKNPEIITGGNENLYGEQNRLRCRLCIPSGMIIDAADGFTAVCRLPEGTEFINVDEVFLEQGALCEDITAFLS